MKIALQLVSNGKFVSGWDTGTLVADRDHPGVGETFNVVVIEPDAPTPPTPPTPPVPPVVSFDVPHGMNLMDPVQLRAFITKGVMLAYHKTDEGTNTYWISHRDEMLQRGVELGMDPPERYFWERIIGRGSGGPDTALYGPYAGLENDQTSRTP